MKEGRGPLMRGWTLLLRTWHASGSQMVARG
jgi:hypothetical protein